MAISGCVQVPATMLGDDALPPPSAMTATITDFIAHHAVLAVFVLMAIDSVFPAGGELVMLFAGAVASGAVAGSHVGVGAFASARILVTA